MCSGQQEPAPGRLGTLRSRRPKPALAGCWAHLMGLSSTPSAEASPASHCSASWVSCRSNSELSVASPPAASCSLRSPARYLLSTWQFLAWR